MEAALTRRSWRTGLCVLAALALGATHTRGAELDYGEHFVGYRELTYRDATRTFRAPIDWRGVPAADDWARRIRVHVWYPAASPGDPVTLADYLVDDRSYLGDGGGEPARDREVRKTVDRIVTRYERSEAEARDLLDARRATSRDAPAARGSFPVILHRAGPSTGFLISELLASHGYVVVSSSYLAEMTVAALDFTPNPVSLDTDVRDIEFILSRLSELSFADDTRVGLLAFSSASLPNLLFQMRSFRVSGIAALEGWETFLRGAETIQSSPHYDPYRVRVPHLLIEKEQEESDAEYAKDDSVLGAMRLAPRHRITFRDASHMTFVAEPYVFRRERGADGEIYTLTCDYVVEFFNRAVRAGEREFRLGPFDDTEVAATVSYRPAEASIPSEAELARLLELGHFDAAEEALTAASRLPDPPYRESALNRVTGSLPQSEKLVSLELIAGGFPLSTLSQHRFARALEHAGDIDAARAAYEVARQRVDVDPAYEGDVEARASAHEHIDAKIAGLRSP